MPGPLQGLHRDPARERLPVAAHHAVRPERRADRSADPHGRHASRRRVRHRRALALQGRARTTTPCSRSARASGSRTSWSCRKAAASEEFLESVKVDLFPDKVYVFTPRGEILRLPSGATVVDFAYAVHTDIGNRCVAAKVDRRLTPLRTVLRNGQTVEIITAKGAMPNPSWVNFVVSAKARSAIRHYLKSLRRTEAIALGQRLINQALGEFKLSLDEVTPEALAAAHRRARHEGRRRAVREGRPRRAPRAAGRAPAAARASVGRRRHRAPAPLAIAGTEGLLVSYARCCFPIPYDPIFAFLSSGRGIVIHRENCVNVEDYRKHPEKWLPVTWQTTPDRHFSSEVRVEVANRTGVLAAVAAAIASTETNIDRVSVEERDSDTSELVFELKVHDRKHLARIVRMIRRMPDVLRVVALRSPRTRATIATNRDSTIALGDLSTMSRKIIHTDRAPKAIGTYSQAVRAGDTVYLSGQIPLDPATMELVTGDIEKEIRRVFENLKAVAEARRRLAREAVKVNVYLTDLAHFAKVNEVMAHVLQGALSGARRRRRRRSCRAARASRSNACCTLAEPATMTSAARSRAPSSGRSPRCAASGRRSRSACSASASRRFRTCCSSCRCATRTARRSCRSARSRPACAWRSKAKCSSPRWCIGAGGSCSVASPTAPAFSRCASSTSRPRSRRRSRAARACAASAKCGAGRSGSRSCIRSIGAQHDDGAALEER